MGVAVSCTMVGVTAGDAVDGMGEREGVMRVAEGEGVGVSVIELVAIVVGVGSLSKTTAIYGKEHASINKFKIYKHKLLIFITLLWVNNQII